MSCQGLVAIGFVVGMAYVIEFTATKIFDEIEKKRTPWGGDPKGLERETIEQLSRG